MTQVPGQVSTVEVINHNNEIKEAQFLPLHYFFLKEFFFNPLLIKITHALCGLGGAKKKKKTIEHSLTCSCEYFRLLQIFYPYLFLFM